VVAEFGNAVDTILEGGDCTVGLESTILSLLGDLPVLLRPGTIARAEMEAIIGAPVPGVEPLAEVRAPGLLDSYVTRRTHACCGARRVDSPCSRPGCWIVATGWLRNDADPKTGRPAPRGRSGTHVPADPSDYGQRLYACLRTLDSGDFDDIIVEQPPDEELLAGGQ
jgi:L-threonylcarbamoyladenylate synthase